MCITAGGERSVYDAAAERHQLDRLQSDDTRKPLPRTTPTDTLAVPQAGKLLKLNLKADYFVVQSAIKPRIRNRRQLCFVTLRLRYTQLGTLNLRSFIVQSRNYV